MYLIYVGIQRSANSMHTPSTGLASTQKDDDPDISACSFYSDIPSEANALLRPTTQPSNGNNGGLRRQRSGGDARLSRTTTQPGGENGGALPSGGVGVAKNGRAARVRLLGITKVRCYASV